MRQINSVRLSTVRPGQRVGFPIFGVTSTLEQPLQPRVIGAGTPSPERAVSVFGRPVVGNHRITIDFSLFYFVAILNGYTISYFVSADLNTDGTGLASLQGDETEGGFGFGVNATFDVRLQIESHPIAQAARNRTWNEIFNQRVQPNVDLVPLLLAIVGTLFPVPPEVLAIFSTSRGGSGTIYGLFDRQVSRFLPRGEVRLNPGFTATGNLASLIPGLSKVLKVLKVIGTSLVMGPNFTIGFPVTIRLISLTTPNGSYIAGVHNPNTGNIALSQGPVGAVPSSITDISTVCTSNVGLSIRTGMTFHIAILKITVFSSSPDIEIFPFLRNGDLVRNFVRLSSADTVAQAPEPAGLPEVVWG
jgi:hypothetical protein